MADEHQRRFIRVPVATIQSCVERCDVNASEEVPSGLAEDVSFRIRQIAEVWCTPLYFLNCPLRVCTCRVLASSCTTLRGDASLLKTWTKQ